MINLNIELETLKPLLKEFAKEVLTQLNLNTEKQKEFYTKSETAKMFDIKQSTISNWLKTGKIKQSNNGKIHVSEIDRLKKIL